MDRRSFPAVVASLAFVAALAGCAASPKTAPSGPLVTGAVTYAERIDLTPDAVVEVKVHAGLAADGSTLASTRIADPVEVPVAFALPIDGWKIPGDGRASLVATITDRGRLMWATPGPVPVTLGPDGAAAGTIVLRAIPPDPADARP